MSYITFNGINSNDLGLYMINRNRPLPQPKLVTENLFGMDGEHNYSDINPMGRTLYNQLLIEVEFTFFESSPEAIRQKMSNVAQWLLCGEKQLIFSDQPDRYYVARVANQIDFQSTMSSVKRFTVEFSCKPFSYGIDIVTSEEIEVLGNKIVTINNIGSFPCKPTIKISGYLTNLDIVYGEKVFSITQPINNETITIDFERYRALSAMINKLPIINGEFFELQPGINELEITGNGLNFVLTISYRPMYL